MKKYPSIEQFRNIVRTVRTNHDYQGKDEEGNAIYSHSTDYPTLRFKGTVKLHGTNAGVVKYKDRIEYQSRERVLSLTSDNVGFYLAMANKVLDFLFDGVDFKESIAVYGEWCGQGIQKSVGISELPKRFVIFGYKVDDIWVDKIVHDNGQGIYHIEQFETFEVDIDFNTPETIQNKLIEMTLAVENECPVSKHFGVIGIGEGIVFTSVSDAELKFKSKGEKHSVSKVKVLNAVDIEQIEGINDFVEYAVTENRLQQGITYLKENGFELSQKSTGDYLRWVVNDVIKEETDTIVANQIDVKKLNSAMSVKARMWFFNNL